MNESVASDDELAWRRRFASRANNRGWSLSEQTSRTAEEDREMLDAAHAAMHLWSSIGNARHLAHAHLLLGQVHALLGNPRYAMPYAELAHDYFNSNAGEAWEMAIPLAVLANAAHCAGNSALYESSYWAAAKLTANLPKGEDKTILEATLNVVPKPNSDGSVAQAK
jgi:hypothetical protein